MVTGSIPVVLVVCPGRLMVGCWSAKPTVRVPFGNANANDSRPGLQTLQCSLTAKPQAHNLVYASSTLATATKCTDGVMATPQSPKLLFWVQVLVCALPCPNRKSLHTSRMVRQLSLKQSMQVQFLCVNQQLFQLTWHTWCRSEVAERHVFQACN